MSQINGNRTVYSTVYSTPKDNIISPHLCPCMRGIHWWAVNYAQNGSVMLKAFTYPWWRHKMETFSALLAICARNSAVSGKFPAQRPVTRRFDVFFDLCLNKRWVNNREAGDLRRYRAHYDVTVMHIFLISCIHKNIPYLYVLGPLLLALFNYNPIIVGLLVAWHPRPGISSLWSGYMMMKWGWW